jgi:hypothetical protein
VGSGFGEVISGDFGDLFFFYKIVFAGSWFNLAALQKSIFAGGPLNLAASKNIFSLADA